jgi:hypothetical protein
MVTAACSNNGRNQLTCIKKDKQKNNNKIRQHGKKPILQILLSFFLLQTLFSQKITIAIVITVHCYDLLQRMNTALSPPVYTSPAT